MPADGGVELPQPHRPRIAVLVNGAPESALADRARGLFGPLVGDFDVRLLHRAGGKIASLIRFVRGVVQFRPDLVYVLDTAVSGAGAAVFVRLANRTPFVVDTGDLGYELAKLRGTPGWLGRQAIRVVERLALSRATAIVVRGTYHKDLLERAGRSHVHLVRDGFVPQTIEQPEVERLREELGLKGVLSVGVVGTLRWNARYEMCYGWDLVEAVGLLPASAPVKAVVIGDGDGLPYLERRAGELGVADRVLFLGRVPSPRLRSYLAALDIAVSTQTDNAVGRVRTTGKLPEYMAAGCYILASDVGEARLLLPKEMRLPYRGVKDSSYPSRLAAKISELVSWDDDRLRRPTEQTKARAHAELDYEHLSRRLVDVLADALAFSSSRPVGEQRGLRRG